LFDDDADKNHEGLQVEARTEAVHGRPIMDIIMKADGSD